MTETFRHICKMGVDCEQHGICYAMAHNEPDQCAEEVIHMASYNSKEWKEHNIQMDIRRIRGQRPIIGSGIQPKIVVMPAIYGPNYDGGPAGWKMVGYVLVTLIVIFLLIAAVFA